MLLPPVRMVCCSAFGSAIERAGAEASVPVMKPNEAMFDAAFSHGHRIAMIYTFPPAVAGLEQELSEAAKARRSTAKIVSVFCDEALAAKRAGDGATHDRLITDCVAGIEGGRCDPARAVFHGLCGGRCPRVHNRSGVDRSPNRDHAKA